MKKNFMIKSLMEDKKPSEIEMKDFKKMLRSASEEELIEFVTTSKLMFIDTMSKKKYGQYGEKFFEKVIPEFYNKYRLLF